MDNIGHSLDFILSNVDTIFGSDCMKAKEHLFKVKNKNLESVQETKQL